MSRCTIVGIAGGSGSGKSTLVERILSSPLASSISYLPHDGYYYSAANMPAELRQTENWDHPDSLENALFTEHIDQLLAGYSVRRPHYDFSTHSRTLQTTNVEPRKILLVEGILLFSIPEIVQRIDMRIFVDTPAEERLARRVLRDSRERGRSIESILHQFRSTVRPMHNEFVEPSRSHAHIVIPWDWQVKHAPALEMLLAWLTLKGT